MAPAAITCLKLLEVFSLIYGKLLKYKFLIQIENQNLDLIDIIILKEYLSDYI